MSRFHSNNGLSFERLPDGSVEVSYWLHGAANAGRADQMGVDVFVRGWTLTVSEWASVMASVSARGETGPTHTEATLFHEKAGGREVDG